MAQSGQALDGLGRWAVLVATITLFEAALAAADLAEGVHGPVTLTAEQVLEAARPRRPGVRWSRRRPADPLGARRVGQRGSFTSPCSMI